MYNFSVNIWIHILVKVFHSIDIIVLVICELPATKLYDPKKSPGKCATPRVKQVAK